MTNPPIKSKIMTPMQDSLTSYLNRPRPDTSGCMDGGGKK